MAYFATAYTIHFDDTMAYGSHHFLTAFKFQCAARESFLFGERIYDIDEVRVALDDIHLITADAYARNLSPARLGDRVAILLTLEEWGRASARFCYRVIDAVGRPVCAGFQTLICVDAKTGMPIPLPTPLQEAMDAMHEIEEPAALESFRDRVLSGGVKVESLFGTLERETAVQFLSQRYPSPDVIAPSQPFTEVKAEPVLTTEPPRLVTEIATTTKTQNTDRQAEAWVFSGQGTFDAELLSQRVMDYVTVQPDGRVQLQQAMALARHYLGGDVEGLVSGIAARCAQAVQETKDLLQVAIHLQNILGATLRQSSGHQAAILMGHSFGEIAAVCVGGQYDLVTGVRIVCERVRAIMQYRPLEGGLLVVSADRQRSATEAALLGLTQVAIAGRNHERQTVVSGPRNQLTRLRDYLHSLAISSVFIASPTSFHHPDLQAAAAAWLGQLQTMQLAAPTSAVYSCIGRRFMLPSDDIAATLASQLLRPFDLQGGVLDVLAAGVNTFVDCGSAGSLAKILRQAVPAEVAVCVADTVREDSGAKQAEVPATILMNAADVRDALPQQTIELSAAAPGKGGAGAAWPMETPSELGGGVDGGTARRTEYGDGADSSRGPGASPLPGSAPATEFGREKCDVDGSRAELLRAELLRAEPSRPESLPENRRMDRLWPVRDATGHADPQPGLASAVEEVPVRPAIAIVGQGCLLPGGATSPAKLLSAIGEQRCGIVDQRQFDRHWAEDFYSAELVADRTDSALVGRVNESDIRVPAGVDPEVFESFSRTQRLLCIALAPCLPALEGAERVLCLVGATADGFENQDWCSSLRYAGVDPADPEIEGRFRQAKYHTTRSQTARDRQQNPHSTIQEVFDRLVRPGLEVTMIDAACASSLYAVALGMRALEMETAEVVVAGGVFCPGPGNSCLFSQFRGLTSTGCRPFDAKSDGVVFSEGAALVALSRASYAEEQKLPISVMVRGAGLSSDGRSSSANVPQSAGQLLSLQRCYDDYGIDPTTIQAIEGHGTSTPVGDSTEVETLRRFFAQSAGPAIPLHSLKSLLGHAGWAAGTASIIAASEYLRQGWFPAQAGYSQPSPAVAKAQETLVVPTQPWTLPEGRRRIAIDGFGFGGANAHVVLESHPTEQDAYQVGNRARSREQDGKRPDATSDKLVVVAYHELLPSVSRGGCRQFDRKSTAVPPTHVLLPDLAEDMDISQTLAISLVDELARQIPRFREDWATETAVVLAQRGKTDRGVEATLRVLANRLRRNLSGLDGPLATLDAAVAETRPSGPYTLQCMMPNVSAGRAALMLDLHGPNFVVDAGEDSLEAAMQSAALLLAGGDSCGMKLVMVTAIHANAEQVARQLRHDGEDELAAIFAVTTARYAKELGVEIVGEVDDLMTAVDSLATARSGGAMTRKVRSLLDGLGAQKTASSAGLTEPDATSTAAEFPIHVPMWTEVPLTPSPDRLSAEQPLALVFVSADQACLAELVATLPNCTRQFMIAVVGATAKQTADRIDDRRVLAFDPSCADTLESTLTRFEEFNPDVVVSVADVASWDFHDVLTKVTDDNRLGESLFVVARRFVNKLKQGHLELWGLYRDGWNGVVHPESGVVAGMLKAIQREFPETRAGVICSRDVTMQALWGYLKQERNQNRHETEVVYDGELRLARRLRVPSNAATAKPLVSLDSQSVVVATGGARGVTAVLIESLLRDYQCNVIAIGRSELEAGPQLSSDEEAERAFYDRYAREHPDATPVQMRENYQKIRARWEAHATIERLNRLGGRVKYVTADVTNRGEMDRVVREVAHEFGRVDLLLHGAGVQFSKRLEHRSLGEFRRTLDVKLGGLRHIVEACREQFGTIVNAHVLTSAYSVFGNDGQHDYGAANETLDRLCGLCTASQDPSWSSIAWLAWDGVGMTRGSEYRALARQRELSGLKPEDGQFLFRQVMAGKTHAAINVPMSRSEHVSYQVKTVPRNTAVAESDLPDDSTPSGRVVEVAVELSAIACLPFHRVRQTPTLPGAWILDCMVQAGLQLRCNVGRTDNVDCGDAVIIEDVFFKRFVRYTGNREPQLRVVAEETAAGIAVWLVGDLYHPSGIAIAKDHVFAQAKLRFASNPKILTSSLPDAHTVKNSDGWIVNDPYCDGCYHDVQLSGPFDCIRDIAISPLGRSARIESDPTCEWHTVIPALLLDAAWRVGAMYANPEQDDLYVPLRIARLVLPLVDNARMLPASQWEIRTTTPIIANGNVRWERTEVVNPEGEVQLFVANTLATRLR